MAGVTSPAQAIRPKPGTPEHKAYMRALGAKGGRATVERHPDHLKEIGGIGGRAPRMNKAKLDALAKGPIIVEHPTNPDTEPPVVYDDIDAFFASLDAG